MMTYTQKITFGEMRASAVRDVLIDCRDHCCSHHVETCADRWPDDVCLSNVEPKKPPLKVGQRRLISRAYFSLYVPV